MAKVVEAVAAAIRPELVRPVPPALVAIVEAVRARHASAARAVLLYGSSLRDGEDCGRLVDLYVLVESYEAAHAGRLMRHLNRLVPPNVYYAETRFEGRIVRSKYALLSLPQLETLVGPQTQNPYVWARFAQPTTVAWVADAAVLLRVERALAQAVVTLGEVTRPLLGASVAPTELWERAFLETYRTELRAEPPGRAAEIVSHDRPRYERLGRLLLEALPAPDACARGAAEKAWARRYRRGKLWSVARLVKAAFTFEGGADYLAYKIERHSGVQVELTPWQRRHPVLAAPLLFGRLRRKGAFR